MTDHEYRDRLLKRAALLLDVLGEHLGDLAAERDLTTVEWRISKDASRLLDEIRQEFRRDPA